MDTFNPQAFPGATNGLVPGMTLRDYFAGQALLGNLADQSLSASCKEYATVAYKLADAMLAARVQS